MNNSYNVDNEKGEMQGSWWKRRSKMEKKLTITSILALLVIIILVIVIIVFFTRKPSTCLSPSCIQTTNLLLEHMDLDVDPCEDFYEFSCGTFIDNVQLDEEPAKSVETFTYEKINERIRGIIEEPEEDDDPRSIKMSKKLYNSCMNLSAIEEKGLRLIKDSLRQIGGWPALEGGNWREKDFEWKTAIYKLRELGYSFQYFIVLRIKPDKNEPSKRIIELQSPWNPLYRATPEEEDALYNLFVNVSTIFGVERFRAQNEFRDVIDFIKSLHRNPDEDKSNDDDDKYDPLTISELQYKFRDIPWLEYINRLQFPAPNITYEQIVNVADTPYFLRLQNAFRRTTKRVLGNYIALKTIMEESAFLTEDISDLIWKYYKMINSDRSVPPIPPRHEFCGDVVNYIFPLALQAAYIEKFFSKEAKIKATDILQNIKDQFRDVLTNLNWMDAETRTLAIERLASSRDYMAYPNELLNFDKIEERYSGYQMEEDNFLASVLNANYYATNARFKKLHEPVEKDEELNDEYATYVNSYYSASDNTITIPAGMLQGVIYDKDRPQYLNYGALGSTIGHQVFHTAFEGKSCRQSSKDYDWISTQTMLAFNEKLSCVAMHYGKYFIPEIDEHLNSSNTKNEDIADIAGVKLAYEAYNNWANRNGQEQKLPGFNYTPKQLFWIAAAMRYCSKGTPEAIESSVAHNYQSIKKYRVLGSLRNLEEFSKDFQCPTNSYMNSDTKCEIW